ncbi:MAG: anti-sigma F factor [Clostridia bacterium]|nr:anti-sigma F factor [Clostridia bacterium]
MLNEMRLMFLSKSENEGFSRVTAAAFVSSLDPTVSELVEVKTAVSEAVSNAVIHGYDKTVGIITLEMRLFSDYSVEITVTDCGKGIADIEKAREPLFTTKSEEERSGMGFTVMESFMDTLEVESEPGKGTRVFMKKRLHPNHT